jgi:hypothetical protein
VELLDRASRGEFTLHLPNVCIGEARQAIWKKCQPRTEASALRRFIHYAAAAGSVTAEDASIARTILDKYESSIEADLAQLDHRLRALAGLPYIDIFGIDEDMLVRSTELALAGITLKPFDQAILASVLVSARRLWDAGERELSFCEGDADLQPWVRGGGSKQALQAAYDDAHVWVYRDFTLTQPARRVDFE